MKYQPNKMIKKSRFKDLIKTLNKNEYNQVLENTNILIKENKEYADKRNYGHLCNLFTSLALVWMYEKNEKTKDESEKIVFDTMYKFFEPKVSSMQKLAAHKWFVPMLKKLIPIKFKHTLGYGWEISFPKTAKNKFSMTTHACIYATIFAKYGVSEMTKGFCKVDNLLYSSLPKTKFYYTKRIGEGGNVCDYNYEKIEK